ncbi:MAG: helix-turn-helix domain-containing protein [Lachnotalea sp.]
MNQEKIGRFIAESRNLVGFTQKELAEKIGISDKTISKWECGKSMPDISYLDTLCHSLDISMNELISGEHLSETNYSVKAEENIMFLMKENKKTKSKSIVKNVVGILITLLTLFMMLSYTQYNWTKLIVYYFDIATFLFIILLSVAGVMLSGRKTYLEILEVLQKISIPNGVLITFISSIIIMSQIDNINNIGPNLAVCVLAIIYAVIEYLVVFLLRQHTFAK